VSSNVFLNINFFSSNERCNRSRLHDQGTSAERRYKRSHRRSPGSTNHQRRRLRRHPSPGSGDDKMHHRHHRHKERSHSKVSNSLKICFLL